MLKLHPDDPDFSYINESGKKVAGGAALLHTVYTELGGVKKYNDFVGKDYIEDFLDSLSPGLNKRIESEVKRNRLKIVGA
ncbi:hypothetical protein CE91St43_05720 [Oscillospiraceae bacterium]|nr:hypothetical protein CE91St43_05720 [Oscillospiraceae bacterium]